MRADDYAPGTLLGVTLAVAVRRAAPGARDRRREVLRRLPVGGGVVPGDAAGGRDGHPPPHRRDRARQEAPRRDPRGRGRGIEIACPAVKRDSDRFDFAAGEFSTARKRIAPVALRTLVSAFADDLTELAAACQQLISDVPGDVTEQVVERYYGGRVETSAFAVADTAIAGRYGEALVSLRHALASGADPVPLVAAIASKLRTMARVAGNRESSAALAGRLGLKDWQVDRARRDLSGWSDADPRDGDPGRGSSGCRGQGRLARQRLRPRAAHHRDRDQSALRFLSRRERRSGRPTTKARPSKGRAFVKIGAQSAATCLAIADLRFAAWFAWMTPLLAALSSFLVARASERLGGGLVAGGDGLARAAHLGAQLALHGLVALVSLLVGLVALDLRLDVCHVCRRSFVRSVRCEVPSGSRGMPHDGREGMKPTRKPITESIRSARSS